MHMDMILLEKAFAEWEETTRPRKQRRLAARSFQPRHTCVMYFITPSNVHRRPQWRATPLGRLIRPMRMCPALPSPSLNVLKAQNGKSLVKEPWRQSRKKKAADCCLNVTYVRAQADSRPAAVG